MTRWNRGACALAAGLAAAFVAAVSLVGWIRPALLLDPEPSWAPARLALFLWVAASSAGAGAIAAAALFQWAGSRGAPSRVEGLPLSGRTLALLSTSALLLGVFLRFAWLEQIPWPLWIDDLSLLGPTHSLSGSWRDFTDAIRPVPAGVSNPSGTVGVAYLELYRLSLRLFGTTVLGVRFPSFAAGALSLLTAGLLARRLLPRGGATLSILALAGMRWSLILSRWGWVAIAVAPLLDLAALGVLQARRRNRWSWALVAGATAGLTAHVYLAGWIGAGALTLWTLWPDEGSSSRRLRATRAAVFLVGFAVVAAPLFLMRAGRTTAYFSRALHGNLLSEIRISGSALPPFAAAADAIVAPWFREDRLARHDLPNRSRLGWILGIAVAVALAWALLHLSTELAGFLLAHAAAAFVASVAGGRGALPNGFRFAYLTTVSAVAVAAGTLILLSAVPGRRRRLAATAAVGLLALSGVLGARDTILGWAERRETYDSFSGEETTIGRAAARWDRYGTVRFGSGLGSRPLSAVPIEAIRRYRLDAASRRAGEDPEALRRGRGRFFRVVRPEQPPAPGERLVERVRDGWGREWAVVYGRRPGF